MRFKLDLYVSVLTVTTGLFLVLAFYRNFLSYSLSVSYERIRQIDLGTKLIFELLHGSVYMLFT